MTGAEYPCPQCASEFHTPDALVAHEVRQHHMTERAAREDVEPKTRRR